MVRTVIAESCLEKYLESLLELDTFSYGIIIGQPSKQNKDYVVHLAKTPEETFDDLNSMSSDPPRIPVLVKNVENINSALVIEHGLNALRMVPGGFYIMGMFIVSVKAITEDQQDMLTLRSHLKQLSDVFRNNRTSYGCSDEYDDGEKLLLHYAGKRAFTCKSINISGDDKRISAPKPVDWKFQDKTTNWHQIETIYDTDQVFPLIRNASGKFDIEQNFGFSVENISRKLTDSVVFINGEPINTYDTLEAYLKQKNSRNTDSSAILQGSLFYLCKEKIDDDHSTLIKFDGTVKYSGIICSKIWVHAKQPVADIEQFIKTDILRSIAGRLRIYLDAYSSTPDLDQSDKAIFLNEPPRRVFFEMKSCPTMWFSDYLFRGETEETLIKAAKDVLDMDLYADKVFGDIETVPDNAGESESILDDSSSDSAQVAQPEIPVLGFASKLGLAFIFSFGILFIAIGIHFILNND